MSHSSPNLERNQAILWARDLLGRPTDCLLLVGNTSAVGDARQDGTVCIFDLDGNTKLTIKATDLSECVAGATVDAIAQLVSGKDIATVACPEVFSKGLETFKPATAKDLLVESQRFSDRQKQLPANCAELGLFLWGREALQSIAAQSLALDQADTGTSKWTSAHFRPSPSLLEKFKSLMRP